MNTREENLKIIMDCGIIAVIRTDTAEIALKVARALAKGGIRPIEITLTVPGALDAIRQLSNELKNENLIGAGTVLDADSAVRAIEYGAEYLISPVVNTEMIMKTRELGKIAIPGALTPTEVHAAWAAGADIVKIFPATAGGPRYLKDLQGPFPYMKLMPTGGVDLENIGAFFRAGAVAVAVGGKLVDKKAIAEGRFDKITETARQYVEAVRKSRAHS